MQTALWHVPFSVPLNDLKNVYSSLKKKKNLVRHFMWTASTIGGRDNQQQALFYFSQQKPQANFICKEPATVNFYDWLQWKLTDPQYVSDYTTFSMPLFRLENLSVVSPVGVGKTVDIPVEKCLYRLTYGYQLDGNPTSWKQ